MQKVDLLSIVSGKVPAVEQAKNGSPVSEVLFESLLNTAKNTLNVVDSTIQIGFAAENPSQDGADDIEFPGDMKIDISDFKPAADIEESVDLSEEVLLKNRMEEDEDSISVQTIPLESALMQPASLQNAPLNNKPLWNAPLSNAPLSNAPLKNESLKNEPLKNTIDRTSAIRYEYLRYRPTEVLSPEKSDTPIPIEGKQTISDGEPESLIGVEKIHIPIENKIQQAAVTMAADKKVHHGLALGNTLKTKEMEIEKSDNGLAMGKETPVENREDKGLSLGQVLNPTKNGVAEESTKKSDPPIMPEIKLEINSPKNEEGKLIEKGPKDVKGFAGDSEAKDVKLDVKIESSAKTKEKEVAIPDMKERELNEVKDNKNVDRPGNAKGNGPFEKHSNAITPNNSLRAEEVANEHSKVITSKVLQSTEQTEDQNTISGVKRKHTTENVKSDSFEGTLSSIQAGNRQDGNIVTRETQPVELGKLPDFVQAKVVELVSSVNTGEKHTVEVILNPDDLGKVLLQLEMKDGDITAKLTAINEEVVTHLEKHIGGIQDSLKEQGIFIKSVEIVQGNQQDFSNMNQQGGQQAHDGRNQNGPTYKQSTDESVVMQYEKHLVDSQISDGSILGDSLDYLA